jgi:FdhD protein
VIANSHELLGIVAVADPTRPLHQRLVVAVGASANLDGLGQLGWASSACGVCGRTAIAEIVERARPPQHDLSLPFELLVDLPRRLEARQLLFARTGAIHAAAITNSAGDVVAAAEDIGRHNAVDKAVGELLLAGNNDPGSVLLTSGRAGFEIVAKAVRRGIPIVAAVGAPSDLSVQLAQAVGMTLIGFLRDGRANVYTHADRITR